MINSLAMVFIHSTTELLIKVSLEKGAFMDKGNLFIKVIMKMILLNILVHGKMGNQMEKEKHIIIMEIIIKEALKMVLGLGLEFLYLIKISNIKGHGKILFLTVMVKFIVMDSYFLKENLKMA